MWKKTTPALAALAASGLLLSGCGSSAGAAQDKTVNVVGFSVLEAANQDVLSDFQGTRAGDGVTFKTSYGASGDQSRAVEAGLDADEVHLSLEPDVTRLVDAGLVKKDWNTGANKGVLTQSVVVLVVRKGNPKHIRDWADLAKPGVKVVTPNPGSSGSAKWNLLAAYGAARDAGGDAAARTYLKKLIDNVVAFPGSGRDASTAFEGGTGDVLLSYENEAILARQGGADFDYVLPQETLLIENTGAITNEANDAAKAFYKFQISRRGQGDYAAEGFRPLQKSLKVKVQGANDPADPFPEPKRLLTIDKDFGGWEKADAEFFDDSSGLITKIIAQAGKS